MLPNKIEPFSNSELRIDWNEGKESFHVPYVEVRFQCPCAGCVNELTGERMITKERISENVRPLSVSVVGRYAIKIDWSDGHSTGMYDFDRLYEICRSSGKPLPQ